VSQPAQGNSNVVDHFSVCGRRRATYFFHYCSVVQKKVEEEMSKRFIVKVRISLFSNTKYSQVLVYNKDKTVWDQFDATEAVVKAVGAKKKAYFWATIDSKKMLNLLGKAPWQEW
jgi:hypothetical protein